MKFENAFVAFRAFLETLSVAMTAANSTNPVVIFFSVYTYFVSEWEIQVLFNKFYRK
jgi:hypothetical protein